MRISSGSAKILRVPLWSPAAASRRKMTDPLPFALPRARRSAAARLHRRPVRPARRGCHPAAVDGAAIGRRRVEDERHHGGRHGRHPAREGGGRGDACFRALPALCMAEAASKSDTCPAGMTRATARRRLTHDATRVARPVDRRLVDVLVTPDQRRAMATDQGRALADLTGPLSWRAWEKRSFGRVIFRDRQSAWRCRASQPRSSPPCRRAGRICDSVLDSSVSTNVAIAAVARRISSLCASSAPTHHPIASVHRSADQVEPLRVDVGLPTALESPCWRHRTPSRIDTGSLNGACAGEG